MENAEVKIKSNAENLFEELAEFSTEKPIINKYNKTINFNSTIGKVGMKGIRIDDGLTILDCKFHPSQDTRFEIDFEKNRSLLFMYSLAGELSHSFHETNVPHQYLDEFHPEIVLIHKKETIEFSFKKKSFYSFFLIYMKDMKYLKDRYKERDISLKKYRNFFNFLNSNSNNLYIGSTNLKIANYVRELRRKKACDESSYLFFEGITSILLSLKIQQFEKDKEICFDSQDYTLSQQDYIKVKQLTDYIWENPKESFTVDFLCKQSDLSPGKLQEGFKMMHGRTVADFIRNTRVERAEELISNTDLNISEIVYTIGLTSRSYFAKIFKQKYNCLPKTYQNNKRKLAIIT